MNAILQQPFCTAIEQYQVRFGVIGRKCLEAGQVLGRKSGGILYLDGVKSIAAVHDEINFLTGMGAPETQRVTGTAVVYPRAELLENKTFKRRAVYFRRGIKRAARPDGPKHAGVEKIELVMTDESAFRASCERRKACGHQEIC